MIMARRSKYHRNWNLERCEPRELLSAITDIMVAQHFAAQQSSHAQQLLSGSASSVHTTGFQPSTTSIALPQNQGPQGVNLAIMPTGMLTPRQQKIERFVARFEGPYTIGAGRTSTEALHTFIRGAGWTNTFRHADIQLRIITPKDPALPIAGVSAMFDRNLNSNTVLGLDVSSPQRSTDRAGRPNQFSVVTLDVNSSAGVYDEGFAQGFITIRYLSNGKRSPGVLDQGTAIVVIHAQIYAPNVDFILRNADLNP
jgi:hypothetical protein